MFNKPTTLVVVLAVALVVSQVASNAAILLRLVPVKNLPTFGAVGRNNSPIVNIYGTQANKVRLTNNFTATSSADIDTADWDKAVITAVYTPVTANAYALIYPECSFDGGTTYFGMPTRSAGTTEIDVFADGGTGAGAATSTIPYIFPGDKTSSAGVAVTSTPIELNDLVCTRLRFNVIESGASSGNGTLWLQAVGKIGQ